MMSLKRRMVNCVTVVSSYQITYLVNNAGIGIGSSIIEMTLEDWKTNDQSRWLGVKHSIPEMNKSGSGSIINISSVAGLGG